jgi:hypothetical protein
MSPPMRRGEAPVEEEEDVLGAISRVSASVACGGLVVRGRREECEVGCEMREGVVVCRRGRVEFLQ